ncbi:MAG: bifunctional (p)ppGpp synthetase/guanosine-3',5'-bis(diphosphate) 3'-pyrophosphohydrolase [Pseudomonadota bacterium]
MMRQYELVERVLAYDPAADEALLNKAYVYAMKAHSHQRRASGDPYFSHPLEVAAILTNLKLDDATIATALLHDVIEDTEATRAEIDEIFGTEIGELVEGLTKIRRLDLVSKRTEQAENVRKLLLAIASDVRVLLVKLADRLHNMRTLASMKPASRARISQETLDIYAPLAGRMGMQAMREELEDNAFRWLHPEAYETVSQRLRTIRGRSGDLVESIRTALAERMHAAGLYGDITSREKRPYSIWRKMENRNISLEQLSDIYGFRMIVETVDDCYRLLGVAHSAWPAVPGRFKDYISTPKQNDYRSLHTTVVGPGHQRVELQIRTERMHEIAEYGIAAHSAYKDAKAVNGFRDPASDIGTAGSDVGPYARLRRLVDTLLEGNTPEVFLEHTKLELFQDQVFCFTPKGRLIALPRGANPIDFAYAVHTDIGNSAVGAQINGRPMPLTTPLANGDEVVVLTKDGQTPPLAWEQVAVTGRARAAIRRAAREAIRKQYSELGRRLLQSELMRLEREYTDADLQAALPRLAIDNIDDALAGVGRGEINTDDVVRAIAPDVAISRTTPRFRPRNRYDHGQGQEGWFNLAKVMGLKFRDTSSVEEAGRPASVPIRGSQHDVPVKFSPGGAVPGDRIVGVLIPQDGIRIFQIHAPQLSEHEHDRWIDVTWDIDPDNPERFLAHVSVTARNEPGALARIAQVIGDKDGNIDTLRMAERAADFTIMLLQVEVWDLAHLNAILAGIRALPVTSRAERVFDVPGRATSEA